MDAYKNQNGDTIEVWRWIRFQWPTNQEIVIIKNCFGRVIDFNQMAMAKSLRATSEALSDLAGTKVTFEKICVFKSRELFYPSFMEWIWSHLQQVCLKLHSKQSELSILADTHSKLILTDMKWKFPKNTMLNRYRGFWISMVIPRVLSRIDLSRWSWVDLRNKSLKIWH